MNVQIIKDENNKAIGWSIEGETEQEKLTVNAIRNLQFFGYKETAIEYAGREGGDINYAGKLSWKQKQHIKN